MKLTKEEAKQIKENYIILNSSNLITAKTINFYDKINKDFNFISYHKIQIEDKYFLVFYKESEAQKYYYKLDLRYNIIIHIE